MTKRGLRVLSGLVILLISATRLWASATYAYTGNKFTDVTGPYTTAEHITGFFTVDSPLLPNQLQIVSAPLAFQLSDGVQTLTFTDPSASYGLELGTDSQGSITEWWVVILTPTSDILSCNLPPSYCGYGGPIDKAAIFSGIVFYGFSYIPGTWVVTPEPMSLSLMLLGSIVMVKRRMHQWRQ